MEAPVFELDFLDALRGLVAFDAETTGRHANDHFEPLTEPPRVCLRPFLLNHAAMRDCSIMA